MWFFEQFIISSYYLIDKSNIGKLNKHRLYITSISVNDLFQTRRKLLDNNTEECISKYTKILKEGIEQKILNTSVNQ